VIEAALNSSYKGTNIILCVKGIKSLIKPKNNNKGRKILLFLKIYRINVSCEHIEKIIYNIQKENICSFILFFLTSVNIAKRRYLILLSNQ